MARRTDRDHVYEAAHALESSPTSPRSPRRPGRRVANGSRRYEPTRSFGPSLGWALAGTIVPGLGLTRTRWRAFGLALIVLVVIGVAVAVTAYMAPTAVLSALVLPNAMTAAWVGLAAFGVLWGGSIAATHLLLRPKSPPWWQRLLGSLVVGVLALAVATPTFAGARLIHDTSLLIDGVLGEETASVDAGGESFGNVVDPWANKSRLNVLVLGGDAGADRVGTRTDTVILASVDTRTGSTVLFSLPRQTQRIPFPPGSALAAKWPKGFTSGITNDQEYSLNAIYDNVPAQAPEAIPPGVEDPGAEALKLGVGTALGLKVDYYAMVNMDGFVEFINALGGITVNINRPVPVGGRTTGNVPPDRWLPPGPDQHLNGQDALWFARGRYGIETGDYDRMSRQRCVVQAVVKQANPTRVLANYEALSKAGRDIVSSDVPNRRLPAMLALALRVQGGTMTSVSFENDKDGFLTSNPDWDLVRERVQLAINPPPPVVAAPTTSEPTPTASGTPEPTPTATPTAAAPPASVVDECAYNPAPYPGTDG